MARLIWLLVFLHSLGTLPTDRRRSLILDLVAKYTYKILSANVGFVGIAVLRMTEVKVRFSLKPDETTINSYVRFLGKAVVRLS